MAKEIKVYNTLSKNMEIFKPVKTGEVFMYNCGPTVYDFAHIGNLRSYVFADTLRRTLEFNNYKVHQVINITDVGHLVSEGDDGEDKMTKALKREKLPLTLESMNVIAEKYFQAFVNDFKALNIELPENFPKASEHIQEDIEIIQKLEEKGFMYKTSDGLYFDTARFPSYGKLGQSVTGDTSAQEQKDVSRIGLNTEKKSQRDFCLWKFDTKLGWDSPWGKGFPGWHIECSAMSRKYLGQPFDIHTGGIDHIPVHHNNEIAQSEAAYDKPLANYWMHNEFITLNNSKMAKSAGGFITLSGLKDESISPIGYRYWLLTAHYRSPANFSFEAVRGAQNALIRLMATVSQYSGQNSIGTPISAYIERFRAHVNDDLDTPKAIALAWDLTKDSEQKDTDKLATLLEFDRVLGLGLRDVPKTTESENSSSLPVEIVALVDAREDARKEKDWKKSDALRAEIEARGYIVKDTEKGVNVLKK
ncbi:MAG: cysteine--tRNA ligase [Candidatus Taylorbacteria bacterium]